MITLGNSFAKSKEIHIVGESLILDLFGYLLFFFNKVPLKSLKITTFSLLGKIFSGMR
jgi:hypothetical protein